MLGAGGVLLAIFCFLLATCSNREEERSTAGMYLPIASRDRYTLAADLKLPHAANNRGWYGVWVMLVGEGDLEHEPFVQGGLMRMEHDPTSKVKPNELAPFIALRRPGETIRYIQLPAFSKGAQRDVHQFQIGRSGTMLFVRLDGADIFKEPAARIFAVKERPEFQLAAELFRYGDRAVGVISNIRTSGDASTPLRPYDPMKFHFDRGTCLQQSGGRFVARGIFSRGRPAGFVDRTAAKGAPTCP